jgi:hypothetical protein
MFTQILYTQWKWTRSALGLFVVFGFILPLALWRLWGVGNSYTASTLMRTFEQIGPMLAVVAILGGFVLAVLPWTVDSQTSHVYPLSLPITWSRYVSMRFGAGVLSLIVPTIGFWLGCLATLSLIDVPATMQTYAGSVAMRFFLAALVTYALVFALQYVAGRRAVLYLLVVILVMAIGGTALAVMGQGEIARAVARFLFEWPGPLAVFTADWSLIDV